MGTAHEPVPVKMVASLLSGDPGLLDEAESALSRIYGVVDFQSALLPFDHTDYYTPEFGPGLQRRIVAFERLIDPADLPAIKHQTNELERALVPGKLRAINIDPADLPAIKHQTNELERALVPGKLRAINIDPGYISLGKLVLASTKDHAHRLYLGQGVYAEVTLTYQRGRFRPWPWTYPDYGSEDYCAIFDELRRRYRGQLRERGDSGTRQG
jgi:hypothetical protein